MIRLYRTKLSMSPELHQEGVFGGVTLPGNKSYKCMYKNKTLRDISGTCLSGGAAPCLTTQNEVIRSRF